MISYSFLVWLTQHQFLLAFSSFSNVSSNSFISLDNFFLWSAVVGLLPLSFAENYIYKKYEIEISNIALLQYETERFNGRGKTLAKLEFSPIINDGRAGGG